MRTVKAGFQAVTLIFGFVALAPSAGAMGEGGKIKAERLAEELRAAEPDTGRAAAPRSDTALKTGRLQTHGRTGRTNTSYQSVEGMGQSEGLTSRTTF